MKKTKLHIIALAGMVGAIGVTTLATKLTAADSAMPSCCSSAAELAATTADTNAIPDKLTTCPVSGDKLGEMAPPLVFVYKGQEVKLCCKMCKPDFDKEPAKYMKKIREADKASKTAQ